MERYNFTAVEKKWRENKKANSVQNFKRKQKILLPGNVSISLR